MSTLGLDLTSENSIEETNIFNRRVIWNPDDVFDEKFLEFMRPHSQNYFSRLRPIFSFEVKELTSLSNFSHILFRDGIIYLLKFFQLNPDPCSIRTKILIHKNLSFLVPKNWEKNILLYETKSNLNQRNEDLLLCVTFGELGFEPKMIEKACDLIKCESSLKRIFIMPFFNVLRGEDYKSYDRAYLFSQMDQILKILNPLEIHFVDFSKRGSLSYLNLMYYQLNLGQIYFSDSFLDHEFLGGGAIPLNQTFGLNSNKNFVPLGPYHGMELSPFSLTEAQKKIKEKIPPQFSLEPELNRDREDFFGISYYSKNLLKLCYELGMGIF